MAEYCAEEFAADVEDPTGSWVTYVEARQGSIGLSFPADEFRSEASARDVGRLQTVRFSTGAIGYRRSARHIRRGDGENSHRLLIPLRGRFRIEQGDAREFMQPGRVAFFHWGSPLAITHDEEISALILTVPEGMVDATRAAKAPLALDDRRPLVRGLVAQARWLDEADGWTAADFSIAYTTVLAQLDGALNPHPAITTGRLAEQVEQAMALIVEHADDRELTPAAIASRVGMAERTLYRAFEQAGYPAPGVVLRSARLARAHRRLCEALPVDLTELARETGFPSLRRFREAYREQYGRSPAEFRAELLGERVPRSGRARRA
ncbi:helix-turn-helix domain-containing protein [Nocardia jiangsuensis]|uniref:Helix-turn-helix domain-containing protein n=1 Tax=Nocardia jiangsuensis TaxID=1691563 RepID=A0ABV8DMD1_9NOCA